MYVTHLGTKTYVREITGTLKSGVPNPNKMPTLRVTFLPKCGTLDDQSGQKSQLSEYQYMYYGVKMRPQRQKQRGQNSLKTITLIRPTVYVSYRFSL